MMHKYILIVFICALVACMSMVQLSFAAESPENVGDFFRSIEGGGSEQVRPQINTQFNQSQPMEEVPQSLPGVEVSPEDMQKAFPAPLTQSAPSMDFIPNAAPLFPVLPMHENKNNASPSVQEPKPVPRPALSTPAQGNENYIKIETNDDKASEKAQEQETKVQVDLDNPSLEVMVGQMIMAGFTGGELEKESAILALVRTGKVGGVFLLPAPQRNEQAVQMMQVNQVASAKQENIYDPSQVRVLIATLQGAVQAKSLPLFVAVEQEGGLVQSLRADLGFTGLQAAARLGQGSVEQTEIAARSAGIEMAGFGINFVLGPAADVNINPLSDDIGKRFRSFSANPQSVAAHAMAFGRGLVAAGVVPCLRNFPGTGSRMGSFAAQTSDGNKQNLLYSIPDIGSTWQSRELVPYATAIEGGWKGALQPALVYHRGFDALHPVPLSRTLINGVLRGKLRFDGIVLSQDVRAIQPMYNLDDAVVQAVLAGADIILVTEPPHLRAASADFEGLDALSLENMLSGDDLTKQLLRQGLGKAMPGMGFDARLEQKIQTGHADQAAKVYDILVKAVRNGRIPMENIRNSWRRILKTKQEFLKNK